MRLRWYIRWVFVGLLILCFLAWVESYFKPWGVDFIAGSNFQTIELNRGRSVYRNTTVPGGLGLTRFIYFHAETAVDWAGFDAKASFHAVGFSYDHGTAPVAGLRYWGLSIPCWFLTLVAAGFLWLIRRMTRAKPSGQAFPVEPAKSGESKP